MTAAAGTRIIQALESTWATIQRHHPDVPDVVVISGTGRQGGNRKGLRWGHHAADRWHDAAAAGRQAELFIAGETIAVGGRMVVETMLHEAAHALAAARRIRDTSCAGRWHNKKFSALAEEIGLQPPKKAAKVIGFSEALITPATVARYASVIRKLDAAALARIEAPEQDSGELEGQKDGKKKGGRAGKRQPVACQCTPPRRMQVTPAFLDGGRVLCGECEAEFALVEVDEPEAE